MPDTSKRMPPPALDWRDAFAALPPETPPAGGWSAIATTLDARRRPRRRAPVLFAAAAAAVLAIAVPWRVQLFPAGPGAVQPGMQPALASVDPLEAFYAESARLESVLAVARDDRMASGSAAFLAGELDVRLATIDAALAQAGLSQEERRSLWQERVDSLRTLASFESNQRWLAAQGMQYQAALVRID